MKQDFTKTLCGDFETTYYGETEQTDTEVWASAVCEVGCEDEKDVILFQSIGDTFHYLENLKMNVLIYYHNLKFDGEFWLDYMIRKSGYIQAYYKEETGKLTAYTRSKMPPKSFMYCISDMGQWYFIRIKTARGKIIEIRDSLKLIPLSIKEIGKNFDTKHQKSSMEYTGFRFSGCEITEEEKHYIKCDVLVLSEALKKIFNRGETGLTIGACCMSDFKAIYGKEEFAKDFPVLDGKIDPAFLYDPMSDSDPDLTLTVADYPIVDDYIRKSYRGGWCYVNPKYQRKEVKNGYTYDVNSLYPSMMHSESGNRYPVGRPHFWSGDIPEMPENSYYFIRINCRFKIKSGFLPFIQIKDNPAYPPTEMLTTSDVYYNGKSYKYYKNAKGEKIPAKVTLTLTCTDWELFNEHYDIEELQILDGCWFKTKSGIFDNYINKYRDMKIEASKTGNKADRQIAKLFLNNLYGKMATSDNSTFRYGVEKDGRVVYLPIEEHNKALVYIPIGAAITSYARNFTIRAAQQNYDSFCYADTDSMHCLTSPENVKGIKLDDTAFCAWKCESKWIDGFFTRQKTYVEKLEDGSYNVKCAGMPENCKKIFIDGLTGDFNPENIEYNENRDFLVDDDGNKKKHVISDFDTGLKIFGKLSPCHVPGGCILKPTFYEMNTI